MKTLQSTGVKKRVALLLSLFTPGLGHVYAGARQRAGVIYTYGVFLICIFMWGVYTTFAGLCMWILLVSGYYVFSCVDAMYQTARGNYGAGRSNFHWGVYPIAVVLHLVFLAAVVFGLGFPVKPYHIPSESMAPTLQIGDYFLINRHAYKNQQPERGDVVVFVSPIRQDLDFVKRILGLPLEKFQMKRGKVLINGEVMDEPYIVDNAFAENRYWLYGVHNYGPVTLPRNRVFMLGDNRLHSTDSRQYKSIEISSIKGKALYIVWARDRSRIGKRVR